MNDFELKLRILMDEVTLLKDEVTILKNEVTQLNNPPLERDWYGHEYVEESLSLLDNMLGEADDKMESVHELYNIFTADEFQNASKFLEWNEKCISLMDQAKRELLTTRSIYKLRINFVLLQCTIKLVVLANRAKKRVQIEYASGGRRAKILKKEYEREFT